MKENKLIELGKDTFNDIIAGILIALGTYNFAATAKLPLSGFNGIALILHHLFGAPIGITAMLLNIPVALICFRILGRTFFLHSVRTILITSFIMDAIAPLFPVYHGNIFLSVICCSVLSGIGYALIYMRGSSTGGEDFITMSIRAKHPHFTIGKIAFVLSSFIILLGVIFVSKDIDSLIYGMILNYILSMVVDKVMYGIDNGKVALIVTELGDEMCLQIDTKLERGSTILKGLGGYSKQEKDIVMCACNNKQMFQLRKLMKEIDEKAFLVIMDSNEVVGEGFKKE